ncbi:sigma-54-dependent Fis family transcriptional regulator [Archangium violaceum]|uniref:sigma-54-dependent Fis family transcriptional regulator n=1 Tax=Archangium violaceum TaxID=83451 RepID=UPI0036D7ECF1
MLQVDELLPQGALQSEVVLHVRRHLRRIIRSGEPSAAQALAMLFGFARAEGKAPEWMAAAEAPEPLLAGAEVAARLRGASNGVVALGHDDAHLTECHAWLLDRKEEDEAFQRIIATDLATLLELSKARDLATAQGQDDQGKPRPLPILIQGDTGVGKELLARGIHTLWARKKGIPKAPFEVMHVAGMTDELINDELFGHVEGAYTGAKADRLGRIEAANHGTLLIDEVGDLPPAAQLRLLRFLQTQKMSRVGENRERHVDARILAATWHDLEQLVNQGRFRRDLFHRLRFGSSLVLPPLVKREGFFRDVVPQVLESRGHKAKPLLTRSARDALAQYPWPGNLRELVGVLEEALSLADGGTLRVEHLPAHLQRQYLSLPLHERASGFLADEVEGQKLTEAHATWRVEQVARSMSADAPPAAKPELVRLAEFLSSLNDPAPEHQQAIQGVQELVQLDQEHRRQLAQEKAWANLARHDLPGVVVRALQAAETAAHERAEALQRRQRDLEPQVMQQLEHHPWVKLLGEVRSLPIFQQMDDEKMSKFVLFVISAIQSAMPAAIDKIREELSKGSFFQRMREQIGKAMKENLRDSESDVETEEPVIDESNSPPRKKPSALTPDEWLELTKRYATQAEAQRETGYDPKTIARYLERYGIPNPWTKALPS